MFEMAIGLYLRWLLTKIIREYCGIIESDTNKRNVNDDFTIRNRPIDTSALSGPKLET